jgi:hypothetical protein
MYEATIRTRFDPREVRRILSDVATLAEWNPAIGAVTTTDSTATTGVEYETRVRGLLPASIVFDTIDDAAITYRMRALGSEERGSWTWHTTPSGTTITHAFVHHGFLVNLFSHAFDDVPRWRLERLRNVLANASRR